MSDVSIPRPPALPGVGDARTHRGGPRVQPHRPHHPSRSATAGRVGGGRAPTRSAPDRPVDRSGGRSPRRPSLLAVRRALLARHHRTVHHLAAATGVLRPRGPARRVQSGVDRDSPVTRPGRPHGQELSLPPGPATPLHLRPGPRARPGRTGRAHPDPSPAAPPSQPAPAHPPAEPPSLAGRATDARTRADAAPGASGWPPGWPRPAGTGARSSSSSGRGSSIPPWPTGRPSRPCWPVRHCPDRTGRGRAARRHRAPDPPRVSDP